MPKTVSEGPKLDSFLQWLLHQSFCLESTSLVRAGGVGLSEGDSILGRLFIKNGANWDLVDATSGAALDDSTVVAICLRKEALSKDIAINGFFNDLPGGKNIMLVRGPALIQKEDFEALLPVAVDKADLALALAAVDIRYVTEPGLVFHPF
jgi:hypothetical protein